MKNHAQSRVLAAAACGLLLGSPALATDPTNIIFFGSSYTTVNTSGGEVVSPTVPFLVRELARAAGRVVPNVENACAYGASFAGHIAVRSGLITNPADFVEAPGFKWDYVVMQETTTKPTDIAFESKGNPTAFKNDAQTLLGLVKAHSPNVRAVLLQTWADSPRSTINLNNYYPAPVGYVAKADQMSSELKRYYGEAQVQLGVSNALLAPVGDAFKVTGYHDSLYHTDWRHPSPKAALLSAVINFDVIYQTDAGLIPFSQMNSVLTMTTYGITNTADWAALTSLASSVIPATGPVALGFEVTGNSMVLRWTNSAALQRAPTLTDTFTNVPNASSPFTVPLDEPSGFFRLKLN